MSPSAKLFLTWFQPLWTLCSLYLSDSDHCEAAADAGDIQCSVAYSDDLCSTNTPPHAPLLSRDGIKQS